MYLNLLFNKNKTKKTEKKKKKKRKTETKEHHQRNYFILYRLIKK